MANKQVAVFMGDDASPEVMAPTVDLLRGMDLGIDFIEPLVGQVAKEASGTLFPDEAKAQIDAADATFLAPPAATLRQCCSICAGASKPLPTCAHVSMYPASTRPWHVPTALTLPLFERI